MAQHRSVRGRHLTTAPDQPRKPRVCRGTNQTDDVYVTSCLGSVSTSQQRSGPDSLISQDANLQVDDQPVNHSDSQSAGQAVGPSDSQSGTVPRVLVVVENRESE